MTDKAEVLAYMEIVCKGVKNSRTREDLAGYFDIPDRQLRRIINELRKDGHPIISNSKGAGYWYFEDTPQDRIEAKIMIAENILKINEIRKINEPIIAVLEDEGQGRLF